MMLRRQPLLSEMMLRRQPLPSEMMLRRRQPLPSEMMLRRRQPFLSSNYCPCLSFPTSLRQPSVSASRSPIASRLAAEEEGPIELPSAVTDIFATSDDPSPLQTATSLLLTGAISVFLFRSLRRRAKRAKQLKVRSTLKEEAVESLKAIAPTAVDAKAPPSPLQALLGGLTAAAIALLLYKFTTTIESSLNRQTLSDNFSVRQITITIRTIINGICYLATFVFGINSLGLILYSGQLAFNSFMPDSTTQEKIKGEAQLSSKDPTPVDNTDNGNKTSEW